MELLPTNPTSSSTTASSLPFKKVSELSEIRKLGVETILNVLRGHEVKDLPNEFIVDQSPINRFLFRILRVVKELLPPLQSIHKLNDEILKESISQFKERVDTTTANLNQWNTPLVERLDELQIVTQPCFQGPMDLLDRTGKQFAKCGMLRLIKSEKKIRLEKIKSRLEESISNDISVDLPLIAEADDVTVAYLNSNFENYKLRTEEFKALFDSLSLSLQNFKSTKKDFKENFNKLAEYIENEKLRSYTPEEPKAPQKSRSIKVPDLDLSQLTDAQDQLICAIFKTLSRKTEGILDPDPVAEEMPFDPILTPLLRRVTAWTPCPNQFRKDQVQQLFKEYASFNTEIGAEKKYFDDEAQKIRDKLPTEIRKDNALHKSDKQEIRKIQGEARQNYGKQNGVLEKISLRKEEFNGKIEQCRGKSVATTISEIAEKKMCQTHDIPLNILQSQISTHEMRKEGLKNLSKSVTVDMGAMNGSIEKFIKTYDYFTYLERHYKGHNAENEDKFNWWYSLNWYHYINEPVPPPVLVSNYMIESESEAAGVSNEDLDAINAHTDHEYS